MALLVRQGLAHWLELRATRSLAPRSRPPTLGASTTSDVAGVDDRRALIAVLATMVAQAQQEVAK